MKQYYVYILLCYDSSFYTGVTSNLENRLIQHNNSHFKNSYTASKLPVYLVFYEVFQYISDAIAREKQLQGWSRIKKLFLILEDYDMLKRVSNF